MMLVISSAAKSDIYIYVRICLECIEYPKTQDIKGAYG